MKKHFLQQFFLFALVLSCVTACAKDTQKTDKNPAAFTEAPTPEVTVPANTPETTPTPQPSSTPATTPEPIAYWDQIHDYSQDQPVLLPDGEIKNLTIQLGNNPGELHISWFSRSASQGHVYFVSETGKELTFSATTQGSISAPEYYRNRAVITGLEPHSSYQYQVGNGSVVSPIFQYQTMEFSPTEFSFTITSDPEIGLGDLDDNVYEIHSTDWRRSLNRMKDQISDSSFILSLGDHVARKDAPTEYDLFLDQPVLYSTPLMPVVGNHDSGSGFWGDHFFIPNASQHGMGQGDDSDYWFIYGDVLFMVLNNTSDCDDIDHELFIKETVEQNPDTQWRVLVSHYSATSNVERYQGAAESLDDYFDYAEFYDIDLFLAGHDHVYNRSYLMTDDDEFLSGPEENTFTNPEGALFITFSTATSSLYRDPDNYPWAAFSIQTGHPQISRATVTKNSFTITTYEADTWKQLDTFTIYKN